MEVEPIQYDTKLSKNTMQDEGEWEEEVDEVNVDFVFLDPNENQSSSIKMLLNGYLDG
jgi:hypothetical protein